MVSLTILALTLLVLLKRRYNYEYKFQKKHISAYVSIEILAISLPLILNILNKAGD
jgi:hypothetical protein